ncbi:MAG: DUF4339 domain-containing protein [Cyclobacteriaceae bacterium]
MDNNKEWYYAQNDKEHGPFSKDDLKGKITGSTLVWKEGMDRWVEAHLLKELEEVLVLEGESTQSTPPPIPKKKTEESSEGDSSFSKNSLKKYEEKISTSVGYVVFMILAILIQLGVGYFDEPQGRLYYLAHFVQFLALARVFAGIKAYFVNMNGHHKFKANLIWLMWLIIPLGFVDNLYIRNSNSLERLSEREDFIGYIFIPCLIAMLILYFYHFLRFIIRLFQVKNDSVIWFRVYFIISIIVSVLVYIDEDDLGSLYYAARFIEVFSCFALLAGFSIVSDKIRKENNSAVD